MKNYSSISFVLVLSFVLTSLNLLANDGDKKTNKQKTLVNPTQSLMNINNATMWVTGEGFHDWVVANSWNGTFPNGTQVGAIFAEGIVWGGKVNDGSSPIIRVNGNTYGTGCLSITRLFRVRPDYLIADLHSDASSFLNISIGAVTDEQILALRNQYELDWQEWPATEGAPFKDVNNDGIYDPANDIPGIPGSSQTLFIKYNDDLSESNYGSPPIGLKTTETYWAYSVSGPLANVIYKKINFIYSGTPTTPSNSYIDSMFIAQWSDPDIGSSNNDLAGCDSTLNLCYAYNSSNTDAAYAGIGLVPPAVGYDFLQGVSKYTGDPNDSAMFNLQWRKGYKYINSKPMSSYVYFAAGGTWVDPDFNYSGTLQFYNLMRGSLPIPEYPTYTAFPPEVVDYTAEGAYLLAGDPVTGTGKLDGNVDPPGDRRILGITGPINLALGDTAEVVIALVFGLGSDYLNSVTNLKGNTLEARTFFDNLVRQNTTTSIDIDKNIINSYYLQQNYPNPFNPSTSIQYAISSTQFVTLKVYDLLGREVASLVNEEKPAGVYNAQFTINNVQLSSGIYFYKLQAGDFVETKKMVLLK